VRDGEFADFARKTALAALIVGLAYMAWCGIHVLLLAFAGLLCAVLLWTLADALQRRTGWSARWALLAVVAALGVACIGVTALCAGIVVAQASELTQRVAESWQNIRDSLDETSWGRMVVENAPMAFDSLARNQAAPGAAGLASGIVSSLLGMIVIVVVGVFVAADPAIYKAGLLHLIPPDNRDRVDQALDELVVNLRAWLMGQGLLMLVIGSTSVLGLWLLGIPLALVLGLLTGLMEVIPYLGAWIAAVPTALIALQIDSTHVVLALSLYLLLHILEGYVVMPLIQQRAVHLPSALILVTQVLMGELAGILGLLVAAPLTVAAVVFTRRLYVEDSLNDHTVETHHEPAR
jgi:predicted PurR-regulated permease PerM